MILFCGKIWKWFFVVKKQKSDFILWKEQKSDFILWKNRKVILICGKISNLYSGWDVAGNRLQKRPRALKDYRLRQEKLRLSRSNFLFIHCVMIAVAEERERSGRGEWKNSRGRRGGPFLISYRPPKNGNPNWPQLSSGGRPRRPPWSRAAEFQNSSHYRKPHCTFYTSGGQAWPNRSPFTIRPVVRNVLMMDSYLTLCVRIYWRCFMFVFNVLRNSRHVSYSFFITLLNLEPQHIT